MKGKQHKILHVQEVEDGIIVTFADGASTFFRSDFLYESRHVDGNVPIEKPGGKPVGFSQQ